jgi:hypothetical protein
MYQGRNYSVIASATNTASTTLPLIGVSCGSTSTRPLIYEFAFGSSGTPADSAASFLFQRGTTTGNGTAFTPVALDSGDPACLSTSLYTYLTGPTLTANSYLYRFGLNQRATFRWIAAPGSELKIPATAANGIYVLNPAASATWTAECTLLFAE